MSSLKKGDPRNKGFRYPPILPVVYYEGSDAWTADIQQLVNTDPEKINRIVEKAPEHILELIASTVWNLCMKMNVPQKEAAQYARKVKERQMGYWFENMEKMDIQLERRNTAKARAELKLAEAKLEKVMSEAEQAKISATENTIISLIRVCQSFGASMEQTITQLMEHYHLDRETAEHKAAIYFNKEN